MVNSRVRVALALIVLTLFQSYIRSATYGSDTAVSIVNPMNIPTATDNIIKTFAAAKNGFGFADSNTSCTWQSIFPVSGPIALKGGTLWLMSDLTLNNTGSFVDLGTIRGANHVVELSQYNKTFASAANQSSALVLNSAAQVTLTRASRSFDWSPDGKYLAVGITSGTGSDWYIYEFTGTSLISRASVNLSAGTNSIRWCPTTANGYRLALVDSGGTLRPYLYTPPTTIAAGTTVTVGLGTLNAVAWQKRGLYVAVAGTSVRVYSFNATGNGSFTSAATSAALTGTIQNDALVWAPQGNKNDIIAVTSTSATSGQVYLYNFSAPSTLSQLQNYSAGKGAYAVDWCATSTYVAVGFLGAYRVYEHDVSANTLTQRLSTTITGTVYSVNWKANASELAIARSYVAGTNQFQVFSFSPYSLSERYPIALAVDAYCVRYYTSVTDSYIARSGNSTAFIVYKENYSPFIFRDVNLFLNGDLTLSAPLTFTGNCSITGRSNRITFTSNGAFNLRPSSNLSIYQTDLNFTTPSAFSLQGGDSKISLRDSTISMNTDMYLSDGSFDVYGDLTITGPHNFVYSSGYTSTVNMSSNLNFENGATLKIGKNSRTTIDQLAFVDNSSALNLNNSKLDITGYGMNFKRGTMNIYGLSEISIDTSLDSKNTLSFGDGLKSGNDPSIIIQGGGSSLALKSGLFAFNPAISTTVVKFYGESQLSLESTCSVNIKKHQTWENGLVVTSTTMTFDIDPNEYLITSNIHVAEKSHTQDYYFTGTLKKMPNLILDKSNQIIVNPGTFTRNLTIVQDDNLLTGPGKFTGLLNFTDNNSSLTWDIIGSVGLGNIDLKGGRIRLTQDSKLASNYSFINTGTVDLTNVRFDLPSQVSTWSGNIYWVGAGGILRLNNNVTLDGKWTLSGEMTVDGNGMFLDMGPTATIILERGANIIFKNINIANLSTKSKILCEDDSCKIILSDANLLLSDDYIFDKGSFLISSANSISKTSGPREDAIFYYTSLQTSTIGILSSLGLQDKITFSIGRKNSTVTNPAMQPIVFTDDTSLISMYGATFHVTSSGIILTKGEMKIQDRSFLEMESSKYPYGLILGDGTEENNFELEIEPAVGVTIKSGRLFYDNFADDELSFDSQESILRVESSGGLYARRDLVLTQGTIATPLATDLATGRDAGVSILFDSMRQYDYAHDQDFYLTGALKNTDISTVVLDSGDQLLINPGTFTKNIEVVASGNDISGIGGISGAINFTDHNSILTWDVPQIYSAGDIDLKGGRIIYKAPSGLASGFSFVGTGTVDISNQTFSLGLDATTWHGNLYWIGSESVLTLNNNVTIDGTWTISGNLTIEGNNFLIDLDTTGSIILERGASVTFKDISIFNLSRKNPITCSDNSCQIVMSVTDLFLSDNYLFDKGSIYVYYNSRIGQISGDLDTRYTFSYESTQTCTIDSDAYLKIVNGTRFSIGRYNSSITNPDHQPLVFMDPATALLILDGGTLHVTSSGMIMTRGTLMAENIASIEVESPNYPYGLVLGDGTAANDFVLNIGGGYQLALQYGSIFYNNYDRERFVFGSPASSLLINDSGKFMAMKDITIQNGTLETSNPDNVAIYKAAGVSAFQSNVSRVYRTPYSVQKRKVHELRPYILEDGDYYYIQDGLTVNSVIARSGTSVFGGQGIFAGNLSLHSEAATMNYYLTSPLASNIPLNGGTVIYYTNGEFGAEKTLTGSGNVQFIGTSLAFCPKTDLYLTHTINWKGVSNGGIELYGEKTILSGKWTFDGEMVLCGNGNVLDLGQGGNLTIRPNSILSIENLSVKGLGSTLGSINFMDDTATLRLSNVYLELDNNMSTTIGGILINGTTVVGLKDHNWTLDQNASMTINGATLWQDPLDKINYGKVKFGSGSIGKYLSLVSSGTIKTQTNLDILTTGTTALEQEVMGNSNAIVKLDATVRTDSNAIKYQADHFMSVNNGTLTVLGGVSGSRSITGRSMLSSPIDLQGGTLTLGSDMILSNQSTVASSGNFDLQGNAIVFGGDLTFPADIVIKFISSGVLDGQGHTLELLDRAKLIVDNNVTLTLRNMTWLSHETSWPIEMQTAASKLAVQNSALCFDRDLTFSQGKLFIHGDVFVTGTNKFSYASTGTSYIAPHSTLYFDTNSTFSYSPRLHGRHTHSERNLIKLLDKTSSIFFDECSLQLPDSGFQLTKGTVLFNNKITIYGGTTTVNSFEFGDGTLAGEPDVQLLSGVNIENHGYMYVNILN